MFLNHQAYQLKHFKSYNASGINDIIKEIDKTQIIYFLFKLLKFMFLNQQACQLRHFKSYYALGINDKFKKLKKYKSSIFS